MRGVGHAGGGRIAGAPRAFFFFSPTVCRPTLSRFFFGGLHIIFRACLSHPRQTATPGARHTHTMASDPSTDPVPGPDAEGAAAAAPGAPPPTADGAPADADALFASAAAAYEVRKEWGGCVRPWATRAWPLRSMRVVCAPIAAGRARLSAHELKRGAAARLFECPLSLSRLTPRPPPPPPTHPRTQTGRRPGRRRRRLWHRPGRQGGGARRYDERETEEEKTPPGRAHSATPDLSPLLLSLTRLASSLSHTPQSSPRKPRALITGTARPCSAWPRRPPTCSAPR